jgi:ribosome-associated protein
MKAPVRRIQKPVIPIPIQTESIPLDAFLKLANAVESGGRAKVEIQAGRVKLNGAACTQRGRRVGPGDIVAFAGERYEVRQE